MKVVYAIAPSGDMAGTLHYRVVADQDFDPDSALQQIIDHQSTQPAVITVYDNGAVDELIGSFCTNAKQTFNCTLAFATGSEYPRRVWYAFDRVILHTTAAVYMGTPVHEVHLHWTPDVLEYPVIAPLGAQATHVYAYASQDELDGLINWVRQAPYQIGIIRRPL